MNRGGGVRQSSRGSVQTAPRRRPGPEPGLNQPTPHQRVHSLATHAHAGGVCYVKGGSCSLGSMRTDDEVGGPVALTETNKSGGQTQEM